jgi:hypothetical protein
MPCKRRSTPIPAASTPAIPSPGRTPGAWPPPTRTCRTSPSAPKKAAASARLSWRRKARVLVSLDYSQIELRILAHIADIPELRQAFEDGIDIHALTASEMFNVPLDQMTSDIRRKAKAINFGVIYGISGFGLARNLRIPRAEAQGFIDRYFERFPGIKGYMSDTVKFAQEKRLRADPVRSENPYARDQRQRPRRRLRQTRRDQRPDPGHRGRRDPPRDDPHAEGHRRDRREDAAAGP